MIRIMSILLAAAFAALAIPASAHSFSVGSLNIAHPWARATPKGATIGGGYLKITNTGTTPDRLVGGTSTVSKGFEIHQMSMENGIMKMRPLADGVEIKPGETVEFKPGGYHIMFVGLTRPLVKGEHVNATLHFEKAGTVKVDFVVEGIGATHSGTEAGGDHAMPGMKMEHGH
jgi:copper(I)-binding protein